MVSERKRIRGRIGGGWVGSEGKMEKCCIKHSNEECIEGYKCC